MGTVARHSFPQPPPPPPSDRIVLELSMEEAARLRTYLARGGEPERPNLCGGHSLGMRLFALAVPQGSIGGENIERALVGPAYYRGVLD